MSRSYYRTKKVTYKDIEFDSQLEVDVYRCLEILPIGNLQTQNKIILQDGFRYLDKQKIQPITYLMDFTFTYKEFVFHLEAKGMALEVYKLKAKMLKNLQQPLLVVYGNSRKKKRLSWNEIQIKSSTKTHILTDEEIEQNAQVILSKLEEIYKVKQRSVIDAD